MENKQGLVVCKAHWSAYIGPAIWLIVFTVAAVMAFLGAGLVPGFIVLAVAVIPAVLWFLGKHSSYISLMETAISGKTGLIKTFKISTPISKVQDITISNGLFGKIFRYHNITVTTAGTSGNEIVFKNFTHGKELQDKFIELSAK